MCSIELFGDKDHSEESIKNHAEGETKIPAVYKLEVIQTTEVQHDLGNGRILLLSIDFDEQDKVRSSATLTEGRNPSDSFAVHEFLKNETAYHIDAVAEFWILSRCTVRSLKPFAEH
jgi:hypothetical protein